MLYLNDKTGTGRGIDMGVQETPEKKKKKNLQTNLLTTTVLAWELHHRVN